MVRATWNGVVIAESDNTEVVENNHYFPIDAVNRDYLRDNPQTSVCAWKGTAQYYDVVVPDGSGGEATNAGAAWYYATPKDAAAQIKDRVAFWKGVEVAEA